MVARHLPLAGAVEDSQHVDFVLRQSVHDDVGETRNDELQRAVHVPAVPKQGERRQSFYSTPDLVEDAIGSSRIVPVDVVADLIKVSQRRRRVPKPHAPCFVYTASTASSRAKSPASASARDLFTSATCSSDSA